MDCEKIPVAALYRVSTIKQFKEEDNETIPVQAAVIRDFASRHPSWKLVLEYTEEGVSAYKTGKDDKDILQKVIADALAGMFKILLVFKAEGSHVKALNTPWCCRNCTMQGLRLLLWPILCKPN